MTDEREERRRRLCEEMDAYAAARMDGNTFGANVAMTKALALLNTDRVRHGLVVPFTLASYLLKIADGNVRSGNATPDEESAAEELRELLGE